MTIILMMAITKVAVADYIISFITYHTNYIFIPKPMVKSSAKRKTNFT
tara:strand:- start:111 stop:254 length:144 start_codon:yes stop_codon:yes gene_type:complete